MIEFSCMCGAVIQVSELYAGQKAVCSKCNVSVLIPNPVGSPPAGTVKVTSKSGDVPREGTGSAGDDQGNLSLGTETSYCEWVKNKDGNEYWKIICLCGKRVLSPLHTDKRFGRCPKCGGRLPLPGYISSKSTPSTGSNDKSMDLVFPEILEVVDEQIETNLLIPIPSDGRFNLNAALTAANRLRPHRPEASWATRSSPSSRVTAWPLGGKGRRAIAGFIDFTVATSVAAVVIVLASQEVLPDLFLQGDVLLGVVAVAGIFNDGVIHLMFGNSIGKKLVVLVVQHKSGTPMDPVRILVRAVVKWLFVPGWIIGAIDPAERTLHDIFCGTLVVKGRVKHNTVNHDQI